MRCMLERYRTIDYNTLNSTAASIVTDTARLLQLYAFEILGGFKGCVQGLWTNGINKKQMMNTKKNNRQLVILMKRENQSAQPKGTCLHKYITIAIMYRRSIEHVHSLVTPPRQPHQEALHLL